MPRLISPEKKLSIIEEWLNGENREDIAIKHNIGSSTVYNIVHEWSISIGIEKAKVLRELAVLLKKNGLTVFDCAKGCRILNIFKKYGIKEEDELADTVTHFLKEIYLKCQESGLLVQKVFIYIYDIINFSKEISISHIPQYLKEKTEQKERLESSIQYLNQKINELDNMQKEKEQEIQRLSAVTKIIDKQYKLFSKVKFKLDKYELSIENLDQFADCVRGIAKENYNVNNVLEKIGDYDNLRYYIDLYKNELETKKNELNLLNEEINYRKALLDSYRIKLEFIEKLETMGFGINELQIFYNMLMEIGRENISYNINKKTFEQIKKEFFDDLKNYDETMRSRNERDRLQREIKNLEIQLEKEKEKYNAYPKVIESIQVLANARIHEKDIIKIENIISLAGTRLYKNKSSIFKQNLINDLQKYGNLKLAIKNLENIKRKKIKLSTQKDKTKASETKKRKNRLSTNKDNME